MKVTQSDLVPKATNPVEKNALMALIIQIARKNVLLITYFVMIRSSVLAKHAAGNMHFAAKTAEANTLIPRYLKAMSKMAKAAMIAVDNINIKLKKIAVTDILNAVA